MGIDELRRHYAELSDAALAEAYAAGEANYRPAAWQVLVAEMSSRNLVPAAPQQPTAATRFPAAWLAERFLDARWPLVVNTVFLVLMVFSVSHFRLVYAPSAAQRLLQLAALLAVAGLFLLGTWLRSRVVEGLVAAVYGYQACLAAVRAGPGRQADIAGLQSAFRIARVISYWGVLAVMAGLCVYFAGRFARPLLRPSPPAAPTR